MRLSVEDVLVQRYETVLAEQQIEVLEGFALWKVAEGQLSSTGRRGH